MSEEVMKNISLEVVRERLLDHVHQVEQILRVKQIPFLNEVEGCRGLFFNPLT